MASKKAMEKFRAYFMARSANIPPETQSKMLYVLDGSGKDAEVFKSLKKPQDFANALFALEWWSSYMGNLEALLNRYLDDYELNEVAQMIYAALKVDKDNKQKMMNILSSTVMHVNTPRARAALQKALAMGKDLNGPDRLYWLGKLSGTEALDVNAFLKLLPSIFTDGEGAIDYAGMGIHSVNCFKNWPSQTVAEVLYRIIFSLPPFNTSLKLPPAQIHELEQQSDVVFAALDQRIKEDSAPPITAPMAVVYLQCVGSTYQSYSPTSEVGHPNYLFRLKAWNLIKKNEATLIAAISEDGVRQLVLRYFIRLETTLLIKWSGNDLLRESLQAHLSDFFLLPGHQSMIDNSILAAQKILAE